MIKFIDRNNCYIDSSVKIGDGCVIYPNVVIEGNCSIGSNCVIGPGCFIKNSNIGNNCNIFCSHVFDSNLSDNIFVGPYSFIRDGAFIGSNSCLIAPISIGSNSVIGASSCIADSVSDDSLSIARSRQVDKVGYYRKKV